LMFATDRRSRFRIRIEAAVLKTVIVNGVAEEIDDVLDPVAERDWKVVPSQIEWLQNGQGELLGSPARGEGVPGSDVSARVRALGAMDPDDPIETTELASQPDAESGDGRLRPETRKRTRYDTTRPVP